MVRSYHRPATIDQALEDAASVPGAAFLAGGTCLLSTRAGSKSFAAIDLSAVLPTGIENLPAGLSIGAGASLQNLAEAGGLPAALSAAVRSHRNRNLRARATIGGNIGSTWNCTSLPAALLALDACVRLAGASGATAELLPLADWLADKRGLVLSIEIPAAPNRRSGYARWARVACDALAMSCGLSFRLEESSLSGLRIALAGIGPRARRFPEIEKLFEGGPLPDWPAIEEAAAPLLSPPDDPRASAAFRRRRAALLIAQAFESAAAGPDGGQGR